MCLCMYFTAPSGAIARNYWLVLALVLSRSLSSNTHLRFASTTLSLSLLRFVSSADFSPGIEVDGNADVRSTLVGVVTDTAARCPQRGQGARVKLPERGWLGTHSAPASRLPAQAGEGSRVPAPTEWRQERAWLQRRNTHARTRGHTYRITPLGAPTLSCMPG